MPVNHGIIVSPSIKSFIYYPVRRYPRGWIIDFSGGFLEIQMLSVRVERRMDSIVFICHEMMFHLPVKRGN